MDEKEIKNLAIDYFLDDDLKDKLQKIMDVYGKIQEVFYALLETEDDKTQLSIKCGTMLTLSVLKKMTGGTMPKDFTGEDWKEISNEVYENAVLKDPRDYTISVFSTYARYIEVSCQIMAGKVPEEKIAQINGLADEIRNKSEQLMNDSILESAYIEDCLWLCLEAMLKLLSSYFTRNMGPEYAKLLQALSDVSFEYGRLVLYRKEQALLTEYLENQEKLDQELQEKYESFLEELNRKSEEFNHLIDTAFDADFRTSLHGSIQLARDAGVDENEILCSIKDIDDFFM